MFSYIARQPIFDRELEVFGYELLYRNGLGNAFPGCSTSGITERIFVEQHLSHQGIILDRKLGFVNFDYDDLVNKLPLEFPKEQYVIEVLETCIPDKKLMSSLVDLKAKGYRIALDDFCIHDKRWDHFVNAVDIIKFDIQKTPLSDIKNLVQRLKSLKLLTLAEKVENYTEYEEARAIGFDYFQGYFFAKPQVFRQNKLDEAFRANIELLQEVSKQDFCLSRVERIISSSPTLAIRLINYVNGQLAVRSAISSLNQAVTYLGKDRIKRFSTHLIISMCPPNKPRSLFINALYRAHLLQDIAREVCSKETANKAYMTGMMSLIDALLDMDMALILPALNLDYEITNAILSKDGKLGELLLLADSLEQGNWKQVDKFHEAHHFMTASAPKRYVDVIQKVNRQFE
ncbi:EAL domain-containing protein [Vibrio vulnificus]|uniref:EAL and HDOD domain-containing protein n=1 Tax=Vibrio vulnificus TaxID=672 RepID=UPI00165EBBC8|nr:EAL domain-containing protein [Vibrio vulnificus]EGR9007705.1 EAL domain-containing protein [Vibrio vulnificus]HAS8256775.1 EAL domain-containing protein [Vibrio vulnificus]